MTGRRRLTRRGRTAERRGPAGAGDGRPQGRKNKMIIVLKSGVGDSEIDEVCRRITEMGYSPHVIRGEFKTVVAAVGEERGRAGLRLLQGLGTGGAGHARQ